MHAHSIVPGKRKRRGSTLLVTTIMSLALASIVLYAVSDTMDASSNVKREDNYARALAAAEYGAELAVSQIGSGLIRAGSGDTAVVEGDFVTGRDGESLYASDAKKSVEQRRIQGAYDGQEFRVRVRSARQVYGNAENDAVAADLVNRGWLTAPGNAGTPFGELEAWQFQDVYEITSSAQHADINKGATLPPEVRSRPVVQAIVRFDYSSPLGDLLNNIGLIHSEQASRIQPTWNPNTQRENALAGIGAYGSRTNFAWPLTGNLPVDDNNFVATGEDHYLTKHFINSPVHATQDVPVRQFVENAKFFGATGAN